MKIKKAAIFDMDGTLIDSMWVWRNLLKDFLRKLNIEAPEHILNEVTHMSIKQSSAYVQEYFNLPMTAEEVRLEWREMVYNAYSENIKLKMGAEEYLRSLKNKGVKLAIATSCDKGLCEICLENNNIDELFDVITYADEVGKGKNFPDIYVECLKRLGCVAEETVLFEDILVAIKTGKKLGMKTVAVQDDSAEPDWDEMKKEADLFIKDFTEII
ncbi:MAG: HAD family phosphatase [Clostridia bacterium]|nr:HAD family phosphatase [Clostridia bacterium]